MSSMTSAGRPVQGQQKPCTCQCHTCQKAAKPDMANLWSSPVRAPSIVRTLRIKRPASSECARFSSARLRVHQIVLWRSRSRGKYRVSPVSVTQGSIDQSSNTTAICRTARIVHTGRPPETYPDNVGVVQGKQRGYFSEQLAFLSCGRTMPVRWWGPGRFGLRTRKSQKGVGLDWGTSMRVDQEAEEEGRQGTQSRCLPTPASIAAAWATHSNTTENTVTPPQ